MPFSVFCVIVFAFSVVSLQHLVRLDNQTVGFSDTPAQEFLAGLDFARLLLPSLSAFLFVSHCPRQRLEGRTFPNSC